MVAKCSRTGFQIQAPAYNPGRSMTGGAGSHPLKYSVPSCADSTSGTLTDVTVLPLCEAIRRELHGRAWNRQNLGEGGQVRRALVPQM